MATMTMKTLSQAPRETDNGYRCDLHNEPACASYVFGDHRAEVVKFTCGCCAAFSLDGFGEPGTLFPSYEQAAKLARRMANTAPF